MNTQANAVSNSHVQAQAASSVAELRTRPFYWSVRRELWENRSIYLAPLAVAGAFFIGFAFTHLRLAAQIRALSNLNPAAQREAIAQPYDIIAGLMMVTGMFVGAFYCLDALYGERRERTILFWKSMPVSDVTTVLSKACVPLVILPVVTFAVGAVTQFLMLVWTGVLLLGSGMNPGPLWREISFVRMSLLLLYHLLTVHAISPAPIYCWFLLVSAWARRWPILWATLPAVVIGGFEKLIFHTSHFTDMLLDRLSGGGTDSMNVRHEIFPTNPIVHITPGRFVGSWHLWVGLIVGALFLAAAVRVRRERGPL